MLTSNKQKPESDTKESGAAASQVQPPAINLPKGGGAIRGIGEKFAANPVTGTGSMTVPIATSPGRSGFGPQLSLSYDSGSGNGPFGFGWSLSLPSITRKTDKGLPRYWDGRDQVPDSDEFILSGAEDLVPEFEKDADGNWVLKDGKHVIHDKPRTVNGVPYNVRRYRPRIEGLFARIEKWTNGNDPKDVCWRSISKDNITTWYGITKNSRISDPSEPSHIFSWIICRSYDDKGNAIIYEYVPEDSARIDESQAHESNRTPDTRKANRYLKRIIYGNLKPNRDDEWQATDPATMKNANRLFHEDWMFEVVFDYDEGHYTEQKAPDSTQHDYAIAQIKPPAGSAWPVRQDPFSSYRAGFEVRTYRLCHRVLMFHHFPAELGIDDYLVRSTEFTYDPSPIASFIKSVTQSGYRYIENEKKYLKKSLPPLVFEYTKAIINQDVQEIDAKSLENLPNGLDGTRYQWVDLDGEGISGILTEQADAWFYKPNTGEGKFGPLERVAFKPSLAALSSGQQQLLDLAGDGQLDLVEFGGPVPGFYERTEDQDWEQSKPFVSLPNIPWNDPNLRFVDLTGDGHADVLITENEVFIWYPSLAEEGFGQLESVRQALEEEKGPRLVFADGTQSIYLADLSGDGLSDLARIRNGEICYWPNLGYGRFGAKVTMDNAPLFDAPDLFDQKRIRLADIDGSGTTDIIYLGTDTIRIYRNQCGNNWALPETLKSFPPVDNLSSVMAVDLLGNGTACLVCSSPLPANAGRQMRYVDLMGDQKPHLLIRTINNLGTETVVQYASSTRFYLEDKENGNAWITRLPFPVHVVERVETYDHISRNRFVTRYSYHHGYFDGEEREFHGFGMVEQFDTEEFATFEKDGLLEDANNLDIASHVPPVHTKTWFHTGVYLNGEQISRQFLNEYYRKPGLDVNDPEFQSQLLPDTVLPLNLILKEELEACRALKGMMLRQEIYSDDAPEGSSAEMILRSQTPYSVVEQNFAICKLQPKATNHHGVFFTYPREAITYHYERIPDDPRIQHALTLEVDEYGNVKKEMAIGYGRKQADPALPLSSDQSKQTQTLITYTENIPTNAINNIYDDPEYDPDNYRSPLPGEVFTYELTGISPENGAQRFSFDELIKDNFGAILSLADVPYEQPVDYSIPGKRLIERIRTLYRKNDLSTFLAWKELESQALPGESYKLAFTPRLLTSVYRRKRTGQADENLLPDPPGPLLEGKGSDQGGYIVIDGGWWIPSGRVYYHPDADISDPTATAAQELAQAKTHFFLPRKYADPFDNCTKVDYDEPYDLLPVTTLDPLDNQVRAIHDYRVLQPRLVIDPNRNRTEAVFNALGLVTGTAVMGKPEETPAQGDRIDAGFKADLTDAEILAFHDASDPHAIADNLLQNATTRIVYDLHCFFKTRSADPLDPDKWEPAFTATISRETHVSALKENEKTKIQLSFSYSDGFGREIQKKIQAEPGKVDIEDETGNITTIDTTPKIRWVGSGWTIFNNKGKPVRKYEPFFSTDHHFQFGKKVGVSPILFYDPLDRVIATLHSNNTYEKVVFDPWQQKTYDVNDTVATNDTETGDPRTDPDIKGYVAEHFKIQSDWETWYQQRINGTMGVHEQKAAEKASAHTNTPAIAHFDTLGRTFITFTHNKVVCPGHAQDGMEEKFATRIELDIEGNQRVVLDERRKQDNTLEQRIVMRYDFYMAGPDQSAENKSANLIHQASMEAGERWMLNAADGKPIRAWDSRGFIRRMTYDALRRPRGLYVTENGIERLAEETTYGEALGIADNHRTRVYQIRDGAGIVTSLSYDFKGNLKKNRRELLSEYRTAVNWNLNQVPDGGLFNTSTEYDALNRPLTITNPDGSIYSSSFNEANLLDKIDVNLRAAGTATPFVVNIDYNAKGQRELIEYGCGAGENRNGVTTTYEYDPDTFRLTHLMTTRPQGLNGLAKNLFVDPVIVQDLRYYYDPAGNITRIEDSALKTVFYDGQEIDPACDYTYDAIYRLIEAKGREHIGQTQYDPSLQSFESRDYPFMGLEAHPNDLQALRNYTERYAYDGIGNIMSVQHLGQWTRTYEYDEDSPLEDGKKNNRLTKTTFGNGASFPENYSYKDDLGNDVHGCMTALNNMKMTWDFEDQLQQVDLGGGGTAYYVYDAGGQRVRKVIESQNGVRQKERIYIGNYEAYREYNGNASPNLERETLHIMDDKQRIVLVETQTIDKGNAVNAPVPLQCYQLSNHLGSASLELAKDGELVSYEEYHPYGTTSFQFGRNAAEIGLKRYRYTGKERDEESGLYYYGARYYAAWLGRWCSADPVGAFDGLNLYTFTTNNPVSRKDRFGLQTEPGGGPRDLELDLNQVDVATPGGDPDRPFGDPDIEDLKSDFSPTPIDEIREELLADWGNLTPEEFEILYDYGIYGGLPDLDPSHPPSVIETTTEALKAWEEAESFVGPPRKNDESLITLGHPKFKLQIGFELPASFKATLGAELQLPSSSGYGKMGITGALGFPSPIGQGKPPSGLYGMELGLVRALLTNPSIEGRIGVQGYGRFNPYAELIIGTTVKPHVKVYEGSEPEASLDTQRLSIAEGLFGVSIELRHNARLTLKPIIVGFEVPITFNLRQWIGGRP